MAYKMEATANTQCLLNRDKIEQPDQLNLDVSESSLIVDCGPS